MLAALKKIAIVILTFWYSLLVHGLGGVHEQPVNRCLGQFDLATAEPAGSSDAVLDRLTRLPPGRNSCRLACVLHQDCWAAHHDKDEFGVETCTLYSYSGVQLSPNGLKMFVWRCQVEQPSCIHPNSGRCPGFWTLTISPQLILEELGALDKPNLPNAAADNQCPPATHQGMEFQACLSACESNRQCTVFRYRPNTQDNLNKSIPSACTFLDENIAFPAYNEFRVWWKHQLKPEVGRATEVERVLQSMPIQWRTDSTPGQLRWTCCRNWWEFLDFRNHEKRMREIACTPAESHDAKGSAYCTPREPVSIAGLARKCPWRGYWSLYRRNYGVANEFQSVDELISVINKTFSGPEAQVISNNGKDVLVVSRFYTQNPFECVNECVRHPCCLGPMYLLKQWTCILFGAVVGPSACTSRVLNAFEWGMLNPIRNQKLIDTAILLWQYECCSKPSLLQLAYTMATMERAKSEPFDPEQLGYCLCEANLVDRVPLVSREDIVCSVNNSCKFDQVHKYAISPTALLVDRYRPIAVFTKGLIQWYEINDNFWEKSITADVNGNIWIPVLTTLYWGQNLWAGPWTLLRRCSLLHCRIHLENSLSVIGEPDALGEDKLGTSDLASRTIRPPQDWYEPTCTNRRSFDPLNLSQPLRHIILHNTYIPRYRCYTLPACAQYFRQSALYHISQMWDGIGYNYLIGNDGVVYEGRGAESRGAHTGGFNSISYGVAFIGWYQFSPPAIEGLYALRFLMRELLNRGVLAPNVKISGHRDIQISQNPGDSFRNWIQTLPKWIANQTDPPFNAFQCKTITHMDKYWVIVTSSLIVVGLLSAVGVGFLAHYFYIQHHIQKCLRSGNIFGLIEHTPECEDWSAVCSRVNSNGRLFRTITLLISKQRELPNGNNLQTTDRFDAQRSDGLERSEVSEFLVAYLRPARVNIMLAMLTDENYKRKHFAHRFRLFPLFCQSWMEVLERHPINPSLIFFSLSALSEYQYQLGVLNSTGDFCVELMTDTLDFLIVVDTAYKSTDHEEQMKELRLSSPTVVTRHNWRFDHGNRCTQRVKVTCLRCCACHPLNQVSSRYPYGRRIDKWKMCNFLFTQSNITTKLSVQRAKKSTWQIDAHSWFRFQQDQSDFAKLPQPIEDRISTYHQFLVYEESKRQYRDICGTKPASIRTRN